MISTALLFTDLMPAHGRNRGGFRSRQDKQHRPASQSAAACGSDAGNPGRSAASMLNQRNQRNITTLASVRRFVALAALGLKPARRRRAWADYGDAGLGLHGSPILSRALHGPDPWRPADQRRPWPRSMSQAMCRNTLIDFASLLPHRLGTRSVPSTSALSTRMRPACAPLRTESPLPVISELSPSARRRSSAG